jgi:hypothetical protein
MKIFTSIRRAAPSLILLGCFLCQGCRTTTYAVKTQYYESGGYRVDSLDLYIPPTRDRFLEVVIETSNLDLNLLRIVTNTNSVHYILLVKYVGQRPLLIEPGETLSISTEKKVIGLSGKGSTTYRKQLTDESTAEKAYYDVSFVELKHVASSADVVLTLTGTNGSVERRFTKNNLEDLRKFLDEYPPAVSTSL